MTAVAAPVQTSPRLSALVLAEPESPGARALAAELERSGAFASPPLLLVPRPQAGPPDGAAHADAVATRLRAEAAGVVLIEASLSLGRRSDLSGARLARALRRDHDFAGAFVFTGFLSREAAAARCSLLGAGVPGSAYVRLPAPAAEMADELARATALCAGPLSRAQLDAVVRAHGAVAEGVRARVHALAAVLNGTPSPRERARVARRLNELRSYLERFGLSEAVARLDRVTVPPQGAEEGPDSALELLRTLEAVERIADDAAGDPVAQVGGSETSLPAEAPEGFENLLIADDGIYSPAFHAYLESRGYAVTVETTEAGADAVLEADPSPVFLCDQTLGDDPGAGRRLMRKARQIADCRLVIALSGSRLMAAEVPEAHVILSGPTARTGEGAERLHGAICRWADRRADQDGEGAES